MFVQMVDEFGDAIVHAPRHREIIPHRQVLHELAQADAADHEPLLAAVQNAATGVGIVGGNRLRDLAVRQVVLRQGCRVQFKQELRGQTAEILGFDDAGHLLQARNHRPQLQFGKFAQGPDFRFERVAIDFADRRRQRIQLWHRAVRQRHGTNPRAGLPTRHSSSREGHAAIHCGRGHTERIGRRPRLGAVPPASARHAPGRVPRPDQTAPAGRPALTAMASTSRRSGARARAWTTTPVFGG